MRWHVAVDLKNLPIVLALRDDPSLAGRPLALVTSHAGQPAVVAASDPSLTPGLSLRRARLRRPDAVFRTHAPAPEDEAVAALRALLDAVSPRVAVLTSPPDVTLVADLGRVTEERAVALCLQLRRQLARELGLKPTFGLATNPTVARLAAQVAGRDTLVVPPGDEAGWLAPQPVELLGLDASLVARLKQFGLHTAGAVAALPPDALEAQFGAAGRALHELAHGRDRLRPPETSRPPPLVVGWRFAGPVADRQGVETVLKRLADRLCQRLLARGCAARRLTLSVTPEHGAAKMVARDLRDATTDARRIAAVLAAMLGEAALSSAVERIALAAEPVPLRAGQLDLFAAPVAHTEQLRAALAGLAPRHAARLLRARLAAPEARCLEQRVQLEAWDL